MDIYRRNLDALEKRHPALVELIESEDAGCGRVTVMPTESGSHRVLYKMPDGDEVYIHSADDPAKCARQAIDLLGKMDREGIAVLFGFGLGYFAEELLERFEGGHILVVYEAVTEIFKTALKTRDLTELLESEKVNIILGADAENFSVIHSNHHLIANGKFWVVKHHPSVRLNVEAYKRLQKRLEDEKRLIDTNIATQVGLGKDFINSFLANVPSFFRNQGVIQLKDVFKGRPAIIVAAGPSLDKNFHLLKKAKGRAVIIAVDATLPTLLPAGVVPDVIAGIDPLPDNVVMFKDCPILKKTSFVSLAQYTPEIVKMFPGNIFLNGVASNVIYHWLSAFWDDKGFIECKGGSVSHFAFSIAAYMGCDVVAYTGQDLSFKEDGYSSGLSDIRKEEMADNIAAGMQMCTDNDKALINEALKKGEDPGNYIGKKQHGIPVRDIFGEDVFTMHSYKTFAITIESMTKSFGGIVVNATEGGLPLEGARVMRLADFVDEYCGQPEIDPFAVLSELAHRDVSYNLKGLLAEVKGTRAIFTEVKQKGSRILKYIHKLKKLTGKDDKESAELHNILDKVEKLTEGVKHPMLNIIASYHYKLELYLKRQEIKEMDDIEDRWERLEGQLVRGREYYSELIEAIDRFLKELNRLITALELEDKADKVLMNDSLPDSDRFLNVGRMYKKGGMVARSAKYLEMAVENKNKNEGAEIEIKNVELGTSLNTDRARCNDQSSLLCLLGEVYLKQSRFHEARAVLQTIIGSLSAGDGKEIAAGGQSVEGNNQKKSAHSSLPVRAARLLNACDEVAEVWKKRTTAMERVFKKAELNYGGNCETGDFYFKVKDYEMAERAYLKAIAEVEANVHDTHTQPSTLNPYYGLVNTYIALDMPDKGVDILGKVIAIDPANYRPYRDLGRLAAQNNNIDDAELFYKKAIELAPKDNELYRLLADIYMDGGKKDMAVSLYEGAVQRNPDNPELIKTLASLYKEIVNKWGQGNQQ